MFDPESRFLSVVIPVHNEHARLGPMLDELLTVLVDRQHRNPYDGRAVCMRVDARSGCGVSSRVLTGCPCPCCRSAFTFEVIVVDDCSRDGTSTAVARFTRKYGDDCVRTCVLQRRCGRGGAIKKARARSVCSRGRDRCMRVFAVGGEVHVHAFVHVRVLVFVRRWSGDVYACVRLFMSVLALFVCVSPGCRWV